MTLRIKGSRFTNSLKQMGEIGKTSSGGVNRLSLNDADKMARDLLVDWLEETGLEVKIDQIGNIFGLLKGETGEIVMAGSHLDTVSDAGIFDGALGVLGSLEVAKTLIENKVKLRKSFAVACFTNEEGARFQPDMMGSMVFTGKYPLDEALRIKDDTGVTVGEELGRLGYDGNESIVPSSYLELHVEQGPLLHKNGKLIGVVEGVQGISWWHGMYVGEANHAGTTPIELRLDALLGASHLNVDLRLLAIKLGKGSVATIGRMHPIPDVINVVPGLVNFTVDFRQYNEELFTLGKSQVEELVKKVAESHGLEYSLKQVANAMPVKFNEFMINLVERKTTSLGLSYLRLPSGAGHDAQFLSYICPSAMIFVPSIDGRSHSPEEKTSFNDCVNGVNVLLECVIELLS